MAVDTRNRRFSMLGFAQARGCPLAFPDPDGDVAAADKYQFIYLYHGITLDGGTPAAAGSQNYLFRRRRSD